MKWPFSLWAGRLFQSPGRYPTESDAYLRLRTAISLSRTVFPGSGPSFQTAERQSYCASDFLNVNTLQRIAESPKHIVKIVQHIVKAAAALRETLGTMYAALNPLCKRSNPLFLGF
ncbi:MAG TPA: hypothetical protein VFC23_22075 [Thermoanaerobaculia bacterium]|nr:hypothetical protein [Thermoanaerobaculia bacterium]